MVDHRLVRQTRGIMHLLHLTLFGVAHIRHVRHSGDDIHIELTVQAFLDDLHMQKPQEPAAEAESQCHGTLWSECKRCIIELKFLQRCTEILIVSRIDGIDTGKHHRLHLLESLDGSITRRCHLSDGITHLYLPGVLDTRDDISHIAGTKLLTRHHIHLQHSHLIGIILHTCIEELHMVTLSDHPVHNLEICDDSPEGIEYRVKDKSLQRSLLITDRMRDALNDGIENLFYTFSSLS